jgi:hypothetical protein
MRVHSFFIFSMILLILVSGCSAPSSSTTSITTATPVPTQVKTVSTNQVHTATTSTATEVPSPKITTSAPVTTSPISSAVCDCSSDTYNCGDFSTHAKAQACYDYCTEQGKGDIHRLDADKNNIACESL